VASGRALAKEHAAAMRGRVPVQVSMKPHHMVHADERFSKRGSKRLGSV
jgi:hypothetical protein